MLKRVDDVSFIGPLSTGSYLHVLYILLYTDVLAHFLYLMIIVFSFPVSIRH